MMKPSYVVHSYIGSEGLGGVIMVIMVILYLAIDFTVQMQREMKQFETMVRCYDNMNPANFHYWINGGKISFSDYLVDKSPALPNVNHKVVSKKYF